MDLTETFAANEAHDRSDTSRFSVGKHDANIADANRRHQPEGSSQPLASDFINDAHQFGRSVALGMACIEAAKRVQQMKADKSDPAESDSIPKISGLELHTRLIKLSAEVDVYRSELIALLALFDEQKGWEQSGARNCADWMQAQFW